MKTNTGGWEQVDINEPMDTASSLQEEVFITCTFPFFLRMSW